MEQKAIILVGTYRAAQMKKWILPRGYYNYPVGEEDDCSTNHCRLIKELWLYKGKTGRKVFSAKFLGVKTRAELPDYPDMKEKPHSEKYLLFKVGELYGPQLEAATIQVRASDFSKRSPKIAAACSRAELFPPEVVSSANRLFIREGALQLDFSTWLDGGNRPQILPKLQEESCLCAYECEQGRLFTGDSLRWLQGLPSRSIDMVFADPPYSIGKAEWDCFGSHEQYLTWCEKWVFEVSRILKDTGTCYICGFSEILADVKYRTQRFFAGCRWIVWHYKNKANLGKDWGRSHESILHFRKSKTTQINVDDIRIPYGAHTLRYPSHPQAMTSAYGKGKGSPLAQWVPNERGAKPKDVFDIPTTCNGMGEKTPHPTQKPEELVRKLVLASSRQGEIVLDPFSGSGTTAVVAQQLHRKWLACDMNAQYNEWAISRLQNVADHEVDYWINLDRETSRRRESIR